MLFKLTIKEFQASSF